MRTIRLDEHPPSVADLLGMADKEPVLVTTESGKSFVVSSADEFETEVELLRRNHSFLAKLDQWKLEKKSISLEEAEEKLR
jgi:PHD/YefM family antitoxin component YafN of YafNO toxin-antitoxin module